MADPLTRTERTGLANRSIFGDMLGWDPFRNYITNGQGLSGLEVSRNADGSWTVEIPVAGFKPNEIEVTLEENVLSVAGKSEKRQFSRSLLLPEEIDGEHIEAKVEHGLLTLQLRVHPKAQPRKIDVKFN